MKSLVDDGLYVGGIFIDLGKAFDTVNHNILCEKLRYYGFRGNVNNLIQSYLANRKQYVSLNGFDCETKNITCGVPQGSSLGLYYFTFILMTLNYDGIYINFDGKRLSCSTIK